ncbi:MAG: C39 family peptidase [Patescibacteria group bacterium]|jgi:ABC-type bacteriocin/lantibiotic exporter with double-glycine peptidase domain
MKFLSVPALKQSPYQCGPTSLRMVLTYFGIEIDEATVSNIAETMPIIGTTPEKLLGAARKLGLEGTWAAESSLQDIQTYIEQGIPVIVNWFYHDDGHYSVVIGINKKTIVLLNPDNGKRKTFDRRTFMRVWFDFSGECLQSPLDIRIRWMLPLHLSSPTIQKPL